MSTVTTVKDVKDYIYDNVPEYNEFTVGDLEYIPSLPVVAGPGHVFGGAGLHDRNTGKTYKLGEVGMTAFCKYMAIPEKFLAKMPEKMNGEVFNYFIDKYRDDTGVFSHFDDEVMGSYKSSALIIPPREIIDMVSRVFRDEDVVTGFEYNEGLVLNVQTPDLFVDARVDDRTNGGVRFRAFYGSNPRVSSYMERLVCSNGMVATSELDTVQVKGRTMSEIVGGMQSMSERMLRVDVPSYLQNWKRLTTITTSNPEQLIHRLARENELPAKLESNIIEAAASLADNNFYDIVNLVTGFQHVAGVDGKDIDRLQTLGGNAVRDLGGHRCHGCQHNLDY